MNIITGELYTAYDSNMFAEGCQVKVISQDDFGMVCFEFAHGDFEDDLTVSCARLCFEENFTPVVNERKTNERH